MAFHPDDLKKTAQNKAKENKEFFKKLKNKIPKDLDETVEHFHNKAFELFDCLTCANCCKTISPIILDRDIDRLANHLRTKPSDLIEKYLVLDSDGDYVFRMAPCPFLDADNYCSVYESRPRACREYPHTNRRRFYQILDLTYRNTFVCPVVYDVTNKLKESYL